MRGSIRYSTMNPQIPIEARQTVLDFVTAGTSFTAYEVTLEVRRRLGTSIDVPHGEVNGIVQAMFSRGEITGYDRRPDQTVQSATPPFRYYQIGGAVAAPFSAPTAPAIARSNLPAALRFTGDVRRALLRNYGLAAREFQIAGGKPDEPFALYIPSFKDLIFRVRCYGTGWDQSEVERQFKLDPNASDLKWLTALAYADEFRVYSNRNGTQTQFRVALDPAMNGTVNREAERATTEPDGLEIEIPVKMRDVSGFPALAFDAFRYFSTSPRLYQSGAPMQPTPVVPLLESDTWLLTDATSPLLLVDEVPYQPYYAPQLIGSGFRLKLNASALDLEANAENVANTARTRAAIEAAVARVEAELADALNQRLESAPDLAVAKQIYGAIARHLGAPEDDYGAVAVADDDDDEADEPAHISERVAGVARWRGIAIDSDDFRWPDVAGVEVRRYAPSSNGGKVNMRRVQTLQIGDKMPIFLNDVGDQSISRRIGALYEKTPFEAAYVLLFDDEPARANFFRETNFDSVPTRPISELPAPDAPPRAAPTASNRKPFDAQLHQPKAPTNALAARFADGDGGSDDDFENLKTWARRTPLDAANWPDFKRLYKAIEARLWPPQGRFRYDKTEADFPDMPIPGEQHLELLGVLMGRLDQINASRGTGAPAAPQPTLAQRAIAAASNLVGRAGATAQSGPSDDTLAYMKRRAARLLRFLRDTQNLSEKRRKALAPLVCGLLQRDECADIGATLPLRLKLTQTDVLVGHPDAIARLWADASLPLAILRWSYEWLETHGQTIAVSPAQLKRFALVPDIQWTIKLAPAALQSGEPWPRDFGLKQFSQLLQGDLKGTANSVWINSEYLKQRGQIVDLFARFPLLELDKRWLRDSLGEVADPLTLDWLMPWLNERAHEGEFALVQKMSPALQSRFNTAIVLTHPGGFALETWRKFVAAPEWIEALSPALREVPISDEVATYIWGLTDDVRAPMLRALADNPTVTPVIEARARKRDWPFAAALAPSQWQIFARTLATAFGGGLSAEDWARIAELTFEQGFDLLPLRAEFWQFVLPLETEQRAQWLERVGATRAARDFADQSAEVFEQLLDSDATGLGALGDAWLDANGSAMALDGELIIKLAQSAISDWQTRALNHLRTAELRLPVALRLMESELPILERVAAPFFEDANPKWSDRVLALADSPRLAARRLALELLEKYPSRWTPDLLRNLAQHDEAGVQAFVAEQLSKAPAKIVESKAVRAFDEAILNARGRARRAKNQVQTRVSAGEIDRETLLDAARGGAPRDREWALQQLVVASLGGAEVKGLEVEGAFAKTR